MVVLSAGVVVEVVDGADVVDVEVVEDVVEVDVVDDVVEVEEVVALDDSASPIWPITGAPNASIAWLVARRHWSRDRFPIPSAAPCAAKGS